MCNMLITGAVSYQIKGGIVYIASISHKDEVCLSMPLGEFKTSLAAGLEALREWQADCDRPCLPQKPNIRLVPLGVD